VSGKLACARPIQAAVLALAVLSAASPVDETVHDFVFRHVVSHEARMLANGFTLLGAAEVATVGLLGLAGLTTQAAKHVACRARPRLVDGWGVGVAAPPESPARRGFFHWPCFGESGYHGFPSGHAATAFAAASALTAWVLPGRRSWLLAVAAGIAASRIVLNAHFLSDVLAGGLFGWWAGEAGLVIVSRYVAPRWRARTSRPATQSREAV
jgi:undecaprenyl-diphosphatase